MTKGLESVCEAGCFVGPNLTPEGLSWSCLRTYLLNALDYAKAGHEFDNEAYKIFTESFKEILEKEQKNIQNNFSGKVDNFNFEEHYKFQDKIKNKIRVSPDDVMFSIRDYSKDNLKGNEKDYCKMIGDLYNCCENILKPKNKRLGFGKEAEVYEKVVNYLGINWDLPQHW